MKSSYLSYFIVSAFAFSLSTFNHAIGQKNAEMKITAPFEQLPVSNVKATGDLKTGSLEITMDFENKSGKSAKVSLDLGVFEDFGMTSDKGKKYKVYTSERLIGTKDINKGYERIAAVQFGDKKFDWVTMVVQNMTQGQKKTLKVRIDKYDRSSKVVTDFHLRCILALDFAHAGDKLYVVENIPIEWQ